MAPPGFPDFSRFFLIFGFCSKFALVSTSGKTFGKSGKIRKIRSTGHPPRFWGGETAEKFLGCFWVKNRATWALWDHTGQERPKLDHTDLFTHTYEGKPTASKSARSVQSITVSISEQCVV